MIDAAREGGWERVVAVFQPHRYTRTAALWRDFADAFAGADTRRAHRRLPGGGAAAARACRAASCCGPCSTRTPSRPVVYLPRRADLVAHVPAARPARRRRAHARRRRPHHRARRVAGAVGVTAVHAEPALAERAGPRAGGAGRARRPGRRPHDLPPRRPGRGRWRGSGPVDGARARSPRWSRQHAPPLLVVGRGSNLLVADAGFAGLGGGARRRLRRGRPRRRPAASCGPAAAVPLPVLARRSAGAGRTGLEFFVGIPGSVGGAVRMNAGGHGRETADVLVAAEVVDLAGDRRRAVAPVAGRRSASATAARRSRPTEIVTGADVPGRRRRPRRACEARDRRDRALAPRAPARRRQRRARCSATRPATPRAGSSTPLGLKGLRVGGAVVSPKHANFFQAEPGATADDVRALVLEVRRRVFAATGIALVPELRMVGFDDDEPGSTRTSTRAAPAPTARRPATPRPRGRAASVRGRRARPDAAGCGSCSWSSALVVARGCRAWACRSSPLLDVDHVEVRGARPAHRRAGRGRAAAIHRGDAMVWLDAGQAPRRHRGAAVRPRRRGRRASGPTRVRITVHERTAGGVGRRTGAAQSLVDGTGRVLERGRRAARRACRSSLGTKVRPAGRAARSRRRRRRARRRRAHRARRGRDARRSRSPTAGVRARTSSSGPRSGMGRADAGRGEGARRARGARARSAGRRGALRRRERADQPGRRLSPVV